VRSANKKNKGYTFINNLIEEVEVLSGEKEAYSIKLKKGGEYVAAEVFWTLEDALEKYVQDINDRYGTHFYPNRDGRVKEADEILSKLRKELASAIENGRKERKERRALMAADAQRETEKSDLEHQLFEKGLLTIKEFTEYYNVSSGIVYRMIEKEKVVFSLMKSKYYIDRKNSPQYNSIYLRNIDVFSKTTITALEAGEGLETLGDLLSLYSRKGFRYIAKMTGMGGRGKGEVEKVMKSYGFM